MISNEAVWTVPLVNLKDRKHRTDGFRMPLTARAVEIVRQMRHGQVSLYVFPGQASGKPLSNMAFLTLLKRMNAGEKKWLRDPRQWPTDYRPRLPGDLQDAGRGGRDVSPRCDRAGNGASGRQPG